MKTLLLVGYAPLFIVMSAAPTPAVAGQAGAPVADSPAVQAPTSPAVENLDANNPMCKIVPQACIGQRPVGTLPDVSATTETNTAVTQTVGVLANPDADGEIQRGPEILEAEALRGQLHKTRGIAPSTLRRLDAALAVIATRTATKAELHQAEAELDAFVATQQAKSVSREAPRKGDKPMLSRVGKVREEISKTFAGNIRS